VSGVWALGRDDWFASGKWGVAKASKAGIERHATAGTSVLGLFGEAPNSVYALGADELIMHFDGHRWIEEHKGPTPKRPGRGADLLHSAFYSAAAGTSMVAFGPSLALERQSNGTWVAPPKDEMKKSCGRSPARGSATRMRSARSRALGTGLPILLALSQDSSPDLTGIFQWQTLLNA
jgi:hypothetical protein